eukprot:SAG31_NODE_1978_length_6749_cov_5.971579_7_plen_435_part_01
MSVLPFPFYLIRAHIFSFGRSEQEFISKMQSVADSYVDFEGSYMQAKALSLSPLQLCGREPFCRPYYGLAKPRNWRVGYISVEKGYGMVAVGNLAAGTPLSPPCPYGGHRIIEDQIKLLLEFRRTTHFKRMGNGQNYATKDDQYDKTPGAQYANHSDFPNASYEEIDLGNNVGIKIDMEIRDGQEITVSYGDTATALETPIAAEPVVLLSEEGYSYRRGRSIFVRVKVRELLAKLKGRPARTALSIEDIPVPLQNIDQLRMAELVFCNPAATAACTCRMTTLTNTLVSALRISYERIEILEENLREARVAAATAPVDAAQPDSPSPTRIRIARKLNPRLKLQSPGGTVSGDFSFLQMLRCEDQSICLINTRKSKSRSQLDEAEQDQRQDQHQDQQHQTRRLDISELTSAADTFSNELTKILQDWHQLAPADRLGF